MKTDSTAADAFEKLLRPTLERLEFREVALKDCMRPEFLFRRDRSWFALSWDWKDQYLDVSLGRAFWFRDVMPRIVVIGDYSHWDSAVTWDAIRSDSDFQVVYGRIRDSLPDAVSRLEAEFPSLLSEFKMTRGHRVQIDEYIGQEATIDSLEKYRA
jgi:hypothetical protein